MAPTARLRFACIAVAACSAGLAACGGGGDKGGGSEALSEEALVAQVRPSVVALTGKVGDSASGGTGVVIDARRGQVLTNAHVIAGVSALEAKVGDDAATLGPAHVVAQAPCDDLAVVELSNRPSRLRALPFGRSASVKVGQHVTALGYPASFANPEKEALVATSGTVSSRDVVAEPDPSLPRYPSTIQHQAPVNPGNSGGPLVDDQGRLIGINTLANTAQGGRAIQGQYYAIAIDHARKLLPGLQAGRNAAYAGWTLVPLDQVSMTDVFANDPDWTAADIGAQTQQAIDERGLTGLFVLDSDSGSPAAEGDVIFGDLITSIEGTPVQTVEDVCQILESHAPGEELTVKGRYLNSAPKQSKILVRWRTHITMK